MKEERHWQAVKVNEQHVHIFITAVKKLSFFYHYLFFSLSFNSQNPTTPPSLSLSYTPYIYIHTHMNTYNHARFSELIVHIRLSPKNSKIKCKNTDTRAAESPSPSLSHSISCFRSVAILIYMCFLFHAFGRNWVFLLLYHRFYERYLLSQPLFCF